MDGGGILDALVDVDVAGQGSWSHAFSPSGDEVFSGHVIAVGPFGGLEVEGVALAAMDLTVFLARAGTGLLFLSERNRPSSIWFKTSQIGIVVLADRSKVAIVSLSIKLSVVLAVDVV